MLGMSSLGLTIIALSALYFGGLTVAIISFALALLFAAFDFAIGDGPTKLGDRAAETEIRLHKLRRQRWD